jgi:tetratricopeptide (TPR) repeat protein
MSRILSLLACTIILAISCQQEPESKTPQATLDDSLAAIIGLPELEQINELIKQNPNEAGMYYERGVIYLSLDRFDEAVRDIKRALALDPQERFYQRLANIYFYSNKVPQAESIMEECLSKHPNSVSSLLQMAHMQLYLQQHQKSVQYVNEALRLDETHPQAYFIKGMNYKELGDTTKAISTFLTATEQDPEHFEAFMQLGLLYSARGSDLAVAYLDNAINLDSTRMDAWYAKAMFHQNNGNPQEARAIYRKMIVADPQNEKAFYNLGFLYFNQDSIDRAFTYFDMATKVSPTYAAAYYMRGYCFEYQGKYKEAKKDYNHSLNLQPDFDLPIDGLARISKKL